MDTFDTDEFAYLGDLSLTSDERAAGRVALQARMSVSLTPEEKMHIRRRLQQRIFADPAPLSLWERLRMPVRLQALALAALLLVAASGGGLVYAAENALPGDTLYTVKLVNEAFRARLQGTPESRAQWAVVRLQRRMDELHRLQQRGAQEEEIDVAMGEHLETAAHIVEVEVEALPAAASERAALRTAVRMAIGSEQQDLRRASRINRVLKALRERTDRFEGSAAATTNAAAIDDPLSAIVDADEEDSSLSSASSAAASSSEAESSSASVEDDASVDHSTDDDRSSLPAVSEDEKDTEKLNRVLKPLR